MSPRKLAIGLLIILVIFDLLRESGMITFDKYKYELNADLNDKWNNTKLETVYEDDSSIAELTPKLNDPCNYNGSVKNVPVIARYKKDWLGKIDSTCPQLNITVISFEPGLIWTPLYKKASIKARAVCNDRIPIYKQDANGKITESEYQLNCTFEIQGKISIYGLCTYREARRLLLEYVFETVLRKAHEKISDL